MVSGTAKRGKDVPSGLKSRQKQAPSSDLNSSTMTEIKGEKNTVRRKLLFAMDYGTKTLSLAYRIVKDDEEPSPDLIYNLHFSEREYYAPQAAAWADDGTFHWGHSIEEAVAKSWIRQEDVLELWKLLLYKNHQTSEIARLVEAQLGSRDLHDLLSTHIRAIVEEAKECVKKDMVFHYDPEDIDDMSMHLFLSVPQMWQPPATRIMTLAAKAAGVEYVELVWEPQCAAAYYTHTIMNNPPENLGVGDVILIADIGGGTGDFVSYEYRSDPSNGAKVSLQLVPKPAPEGSLCGSEFVNQQFISWLKKHRDGFANQCKLLGLTPMACIKKASEAFEFAKQQFSYPEAGPKTIPIDGAQNAAKQSWNIRVTSADMVNFFKPVVREIVRCIDAQRTPRTKFLIIPGGFKRSKYLLNLLKKRYEPRIMVHPIAPSSIGAYEPVSRGALYRYKDIVVRGLPSLYSFGIGQDEIYDSSIHVDATDYPDDVIPNTSKRRHNEPSPNKIVEKCPIYGGLVVYERWLTIIPRDMLKEPGNRFTTETWQLYVVPIDEAVISIQIYCTMRRINDHDPILTDSNRIVGNLREGIEEYGPPLEKKLPDLGELGFEAKQSESKGLVYELYYRLVMECDGPNISIRWQIAKPGTEPYDEEGGRRTSNVQLADNQVFHLSEEAYNPFPRGSPT